VFVYTEPVQIEQLVLQASEVSEVRWFVLNEVWNEIQNGNRSYKFRSDRAICTEF